MVPSIMFNWIGPILGKVFKRWSLAVATIVLAVAGVAYLGFRLVVLVFGGTIESAIQNYATGFWGHAVSAPIAEILYWSVWAIVAIILIYAAIAWLLSVFRRLTGDSTVPETATPKGQVDEPYSNSWGRNAEFTLQEAACLWVGLEPDHTPPRSKPYPVLQRLIAAAEEEDGPLDISDPSDEKETWALRASREALIAYCDETKQRPDFLFPGGSKTSVEFLCTDESAISKNPSRIKMISGIDRVWDVVFLNPIPKANEVFYVSERGGGACVELSRSENGLTLRIDEFAPCIKITFD